MRRMLMVVATAAGMALLACGVAAAQTVSTDFEGLAPGTVNGKDGWKSAPPGAGIPGSPTGEFDQAIVANSGGPAAFGQQSLRMSNRYASGVFVYQTYSEQVLPAAGENQVNTVYDARFSFISTTPAAQQPGLYLTVSPDDYHGGRMAWVDLRDTDAGIHVNVSDAPAADGKFRTYDAGVLAREVPHTIRFWIKVTPGADNDLMRIFIDGRDLGECFTTWENYYRAPGPPPQASAPPVINSLQFRSSVPGPAPLAGAGYLFDNVTATASSGAGVTDCSPPPEPDIDIDKTTRTRLAEPGDLITYRVSVTNRGDAPVRALRACDRAPRALAFLQASRRLQRAAGG